MYRWVNNNALHVNGLCAHRKPNIYSFFSFSKDIPFPCILYCRRASSAHADNVKIYKSQHIAIPISAAEDIHEGVALYRNASSESRRGIHKTEHRQPPPPRTTERNTYFRDGAAFQISISFNPNGRPKLGSFSTSIGFAIDKWLLSSGSVPSRSLSRNHQSHM